MLHKRLPNILVYVDTYAYIHIEQAREVPSGP